MYTTENRFIDYVTQKHIGQIGTITKSDLKSDFASAYDAKISAMPSFLVPNKRVLVEECCHDIPMLALKLLGHQKKHERIVAHEHRRFLGKRLALDYTRHPDLRANLYGRVDFVMSNALPKVIELNIGSPNGGWEILVYEPLYRQLNVVVDYLAHHTKEQWQTRNTLFIQFMTMVQSVIAKGLNGQSKVNFLLLLDAELIDAGIEPLLAGLSAQLSQAVNQQVNLHCFSDTQLFIEENQLLTVNGEVIHCLLDGQFEQRCDIPDFVHQLFFHYGQSSCY